MNSGGNFFFFQMFFTRLAIKVTFSIYPLTTVAPEFSDTLTLFQPGGQNMPPPHRRGRT